MIPASKDPLEAAVFTRAKGLRGMPVGARFSCARLVGEMFGLALPLTPLVSAKLDRPGWCRLFGVAAIDNGVRLSLVL